MALGLSSASPRTPEVARQHLADYYAAITHLDAQIKDFEKQIRTLCREQGTLYDRLRDIPFVGPICAAYLVALLWRPEMFTHFKALTAYCGLDVVLCESGRFKGQSRISKRGWSSFRGALSAARGEGRECRRRAVLPPGCSNASRRG